LSADGGMSLREQSGVPSRFNGAALS